MTLASAASDDVMAEGGQDEAVVMLEDAEGEAPPAQVYKRIPGFKLSRNSTPAKVSSRGGCEQLCNQQPSCKSYSFAAGSASCLWSTSKMHYDPDFTFAE